MQSLTHATVLLLGAGAGGSLHRVWLDQ